MKNKSQDGFSLIEVLIVFVILGILAIVTFPYVSKAKGAAQNGNAYASMRAMLSAQYNFYSQNARYARMSELNASQSNNMGELTPEGNLIRGSFLFSMPGNPTDQDLRDSFTIIGSRPTTTGELPVVMTVTERGHSTGLFEN